MVSSKLIKKPLVSVVIVNFNGERFIRNCLDSVLNTAYPNFEIIVVDNNSTDKSAQILEGFRNNPKVKIILLNHNMHFAGGNNVGISHSRGDYIVFLNNDTEVDSNWLSESVKSFQLNEDISGTQCLLLRSDRETVDSIGGTIDYCAKLFPANYLWASNEEAAKEHRLFYGCGAALSVRRSVLEKIGFFDLSLPTDEVDICWRINLSGGQIVLVPKSIVYHFRGGTFGKKLNKHRVFFSEISAVSAILKNYEFGSVVSVLPYYLFFSFLAVGVDVLVRHRLDVTLYRLKAYFQVIRDLKRIFQKRAFVQQYIRRISDAELRKLMLRPNVLRFSVF